EETKGRGSEGDGPEEETFEIDLEGLTEEDVRELLFKAKASEEHRESLQRLRAEHENYRKRMAREAAVQRQWALRDFALDALFVVDDLERALEAPVDAGEGSIREGVEMVLQKFMAALKRHEVRIIEAVGKPFDPAFHEAVGQIPSQDVDPGNVAVELQRGYLLKDLVIRPSRVMVARENDSTNGSEGEEGNP
ncbi:MAG: nucleotide exchange factor GrpE, partial [Planctomycetota bacterium]